MNLPTSFFRRYFLLAGVGGLMLGSISCSASLAKRDSFRDHCCGTAEASKLYNEGNEKSKAGDRQKAIELYQEALRLEPSYLCAKVNLGLLFWKEKRYPEALTLLQEVSQIDPKDVLIHDNLGDIHKELGELVQAEAEYQKVVALDPSRHRGLYDLAGVQRDLKKYPEAAGNYETYIKLAGSSAKDEKRVAYAHSYLAWYLKREAGKRDADASLRALYSAESASPSQQGGYVRTVQTARDNRQCANGHALVILLDKSRSVGADSLIEQEKSMTLAVLPKIPSSVTLGITAFDSTPFLLTRLARLDEEQRKILPERLKKLFGVGKTNVIAGLTFARTQLEKDPAGCKSVVLVSDGKFSVEGEEIKKELDNYRAKNIHLSTIMLGSEGDWPLMKLMSTAGQGSFTQLAGKATDERVLLAPLTEMGIVPAVKEQKPGKGK